MKSNASLFQLAVSMPRTEETECALWPTPMASSWGGSGHRKTLKALQAKGLITEAERLSLQKGNQIDTNPEFLEWLMGYERSFTEKLMPTPTQTDYKGGITGRFVGGGGLQEPSPRIHRMHSAWENWPDEPGVDRVVDGIPNRMDRIKCLGNAVVPQQFYPFFAAIVAVTKKQFEEEDNVKGDQA